MFKEHITFKIIHIQIRDVRFMCAFGYLMDLLDFYFHLHFVCIYNEWINVLYIFILKCKYKSLMFYIIKYFIKFNRQ